jgi:hypothetical protein
MNHNELREKFLAKYYDGETIAAESQILRKEDSKIAPYDEILSLLSSQDTSKCEFCGGKKTELMQHMACRAVAKAEKDLELDTSKSDTKECCKCHRINGTVPVECPCECHLPKNEWDARYEAGEVPFDTPRHAQVNHSDAEFIVVSPDVKHIKLARGTRIYEIDLY